MTCRWCSICPTALWLCIWEKLSKSPTPRRFTMNRCILTPRLCCGNSSSDIHNKKKAPGTEGEVPSPIRKPSGCAFHNRCPNCMEICKTVDPAMLHRGKEAIWSPATCMTTRWSGSRNMRLEKSKALMLFGRCWHCRHPRCGQGGRSRVFGTAFKRRTNFFRAPAFYPGTWGLGLIGPENADDEDDLVQSILNVGCGMADELLVRSFVSGIGPAISEIEGWESSSRRRRSKIKDFIPLL